MTYSVVNVGDEQNQILSIIHTSEDGGQQVIALQVTPGYADEITRLLNLVKGVGLSAHFDGRQREQIEFCRLYAQDFAHGAPGHIDMMIIAKLANLLGTTETRMRVKEEPRDGALDKCLTCGGVVVFWHNSWTHRDLVEEPDHFIDRWNDPIHGEE